MSVGHVLPLGVLVDCSRGFDAALKRALRVGRRKGVQGGVMVLTASLVFGGAAYPIRCVKAGTMTGAASEWTQILNNIALLQQIIHAIRAVIALKKQVEYMAKSVKDFSKGDFKSLDTMLTGFDDILGQTRGLIYAGQNLKDMWEQIHPGRVDPSAMEQTDEQAYSRIDEGVQKSVSKALQVIEAQGKIDNKSIGEALKRKMDSAEGQLQVSKVANDLLLDIRNQLILLHQTVQAQAVMQGEDISASAQIRQYDSAIRERRRYRRNPTPPIDWSER